MVINSDPLRDQRPENIKTKKNRSWVAGRGEMRPVRAKVILAQ